MRAIDVLPMRSKENSQWKNFRMHQPNLLAQRAFIALSPANLGYAFSSAARFRAASWGSVIMSIHFGSGEASVS